MQPGDMIKYGEWSARQYWQYQKRGSWKYSFHGDTLVRYVEMAPADPNFAAGLLEWLKNPESVTSATVYNRPANLSAEWKPVSAWYEQQEGQVDERTKLKIIRVYQALQKATAGGEGDGPYTVEKGCRYKVSFTYHWKVERLPDVPQGTSGVGYTLEQVTRDDETGLWNCCVVKRERVQQDVGEYTAEVTEFEARTEEQHLGVKAERVAATGKAASAGGGVMVKRQVRKNEDCTSDIVNETVTERPVEGAAVTVEKTLRAETRTVEDRNMDAKLPETGLKAGERVRNERTPGGKWNRSKSVTTATPPEGPIRKTCRKTVFEHVDSKTEVLKDRPEMEHADEAADGKVTTETVRALEDSTFEHETEVRQEQTAEGAVEETRKMLRGVKKITVNRNMQAKATTAGMKVGSAVRNEKTEGGRWNQTIEETEPTPSGKIQERCEKNALQHVHTRTENVAADPGTADAMEVNGGTIHRKEVRKTEEGTFDVTETTDTAMPAADTVEGGSECRMEMRTEYRNQPAITPPEPQTNVEVNASVRTNEHGLKDGTVEVVEHRKAEKTARGGTALYDEEEIVAINDEEEPSESPGEGQTVTCRANPNEHGSATTSRIVRTAKPKVCAPVTWTTTDDTWTYTHGIQVYRNQDAPPTPPSGKYQCSMSLSINEFGRYDAIVSWTERRGGSGDGQQSYSKEGTATRWLTYQNKEGQICKRLVTAHVRKRRERSGVYHTPEIGENGYGFNSRDDGSYGEVYTNITLGSEIVIS